MVKSFFKGYQAMEDVPEGNDNNRQQNHNNHGLMIWNSQKASEDAGFFKQKR